MLRSYLVSNLSLREFEGVMRNFALHNNATAVMMFDEPIIKKFASMSKCQPQGHERLEIMPEGWCELDTIIVEYYNAGGQKCVLKKIMTKQVQRYEEIYVSPECWNTINMVYLY